MDDFWLGVGVGFVSAVVCGVIGAFIFFSYVVRPSR